MISWFCVFQKSIIESKAIFINISDKAIAKEKMEKLRQWADAVLCMYVCMICFDC